MDKFLNMIRSLSNIDGFQLPELSKQQQGSFLADPVRYLISADEGQQAAIYREVMKRQKPDTFLRQIEALWHSTAKVISYHHADDSGTEWCFARDYQPLILELERQIKSLGGAQPKGEYLLGHGFRIEWDSAA